MEEISQRLTRSGIVRESRRRQKGALAVSAYVGASWARDSCPVLHDYLTYWSRPRPATWSVLDLHKRAARGVGCRWQGVLAKRGPREAPVEALRERGCGACSVHTLA